MLAGKVEISGGCVMDHADVGHALRETGRVDDFCWDGESTIIARLMDGNVKLRMATHECSADKNTSSSP
jgi:hypothetical protein